LSFGQNRKRLLVRLNNDKNRPRDKIPRQQVISLQMHSCIKGSSVGVIS